MINGIDLNKTVDFKLKSDKKEPTIWKLSAIPASISGQIAMGNDWEKSMTVLRCGLKGWENFNIEYKTEESIRLTPES